MMPLPQLWSSCFFIMLLLLGMDSQVIMSHNFHLNVLWLKDFCLVSGLWSLKVLPTTQTNNDCLFNKNQYNAQWRETWSLFIRDQTSEERFVSSLFSLCPIHNILQSNLYQPTEPTIHYLLHWTLKTKSEQEGLFKLDPVTHCLSLCFPLVCTFSDIRNLCHWLVPTTLRRRGRRELCPPL